MTLNKYKFSICVFFGALIVSIAAYATNSAVNTIPPKIQKELYNPHMIDPDQPIGPSAYMHWHAKHPPPWTIGFASSYAGNTWRANEMQRLKNKLIPKWKKLGLLSKVIITQSNLNNSRQIQQIRQLVSEHVDAIIVCCSNPTALNQSVAYAHNHGVPVFSATGYLTSKYAVNESANFVLGGYMMGQTLAKDMNKKGNVLLVEGIPGASASDSQDKGIRKALAKYPHIKIVGDINGMWTNQIAQSKIQRWLATHPGKLGGIAIQSASELGAVRAMKQSGRKMVPITIGGELGALCYWRKHPNFISGAVQAWPPGSDFEATWNIMMRTLEGQGPKIESILTKPTMLTYKQLTKTLGKNCNENSSGWYNVPMRNWASVQYLNHFFLHPANPEKFTPSDYNTLTKNK